MPMTHEARQFYHILDMVENMEEEILRKRVKHMPLYIAAHNYERERANQTTNASFIQDIESSNLSTLRTTNYIDTVITNTTPAHHDNTSSINVIKNPILENNPSNNINRNRSISTSDFILKHFESHPATLCGDNISVNHENSDYNDDDSNIILSNTSSRIYDDFDNCEEYSYMIGGNSSSSAIKRKYGPRKSPNSRIAHNMNEKNRRADLRESLDKLKLALPHFHQKNSKSTTADILQSGYKYIKDMTNMYYYLTQERNRMFNISKKYKIELFSHILNFDVPIYTPHNDDPINEQIKSSIRIFLDTCDNIHSESLINLDICRQLFPSIDYKIIELSRKKYLQSASVSMSPSLFRTKFNLINKFKLALSPGNHNNKKEYSESTINKVNDTTTESSNKISYSTNLTSLYNDSSKFGEKMCSFLTYNSPTTTTHPQTNDHSLDQSLLPFSMVAKQDSHSSPYQPHDNIEGRHNNDICEQTANLSIVCETPATIPDFNNISGSSCCSSNQHLLNNSATISDDNDDTYKNDLICEPYSTNQLVPHIDGDLISSNNYNSGTTSTSKNTDITTSTSTTNETSF